MTKRMIPRAPSQIASPTLEPVRAPVLGVAVVAVPPVAADGEGEAAVQVGWVKVLSSRLTYSRRSRNRCIGGYRAADGRNGLGGADNFRNRASGG